jgi:hypothetical protein
MTDLDFEELDKAVSSLMGKQSAKPAVTSQDTPVEADDITASSTESESADTPVVFDAPLSPQAEPTSEVEAVSETDTPASQEEAVVAPELPLASAEEAPQEPQGETVRPPKRSGRFMDVVHPSSDMKTASSPVSRQGVTLQPQTTSSISDAMTDITKSESPTDMTGADMPKTMVADVLPPVENFGTASSPFLPDAQVEKRPLGGITMSTEKSEVDAPATADTIKPDDNDEAAVNDTAKKLKEVLAQDEQEHDEPKIVLPEELSNDLVAIESGMVVQESSETTEPEVAPVEDEVGVQKPTPSIVHELQESTMPEPVMGSIPQQYTEAAPETEAVHSPIYDDVAAQPVLAPPKKKSKVLILILVLIGIVLAVATAAGLYFMNLL